MRRMVFGFGVLVLLLMTGFFTIQIPVQAQDSFQQPTDQIPTVTSTAGGPMVTVKSDQEQFINVRSGPGIFYDKIGVILAGQQLPAKGRSVGGDWILIEYPGVPGSEAWVYAPFVSLTPGELPIVEPPATPTPLVTATIDPTLAAEFVITSEPSRLPTFTEPPPLVLPTYPQESNLSLFSSIPMGMIIIIVAAIGILLAFFSLTQGRS